MGMGACSPQATSLHVLKQTGDENLELIRMSERVKMNPNAVIDCNRASNTVWIPHLWTKSPMDSGRILMRKSVKL